MARKLRIEYPGALYHVINRGNYRRPIFGTIGAAKAFVTVLGQACEQTGWRLHGYSVMLNHFHLALETPEPNLVEGMHWLESTFATRFNRFRNERGHLFQGRYQSLLVEDEAALTRLVNYIHLNPVEAKIVSPAEVATYRWGSLAQFTNRRPPPWLIAARFLAQLGLADSADGWERYVSYLMGLSADPAEQQRQEFDQLCNGWAIGSMAWRRAVAREHEHFAIEPGFERAQLREIKEARWNAALDELLRDRSQTRADLVGTPSGERWKMELACSLRLRVAAPYRWIATTLHIGSPGSIRMHVCRCKIHAPAGISDLPTL